MAKRAFDGMMAGITDAIAYRLPIGTLRDWEQRRSQPDAPARVLLALIGAAPDTIERLVRQV